METSSFSVLELFNLGGIVMWPLLFFSIVVVAISLERIFYLNYHKFNIDDLEIKVAEYINNNDYSGAAEYLKPLTKKNMGARILLTLTEQVKPGKEFSEYKAERAVEIEASNCINSLENGFNFLTTLGSLSPLTGFLGTVTGMIGAFRSIAEATEVNAQIVANGIYEALITTVFGLIIAIIAMVSHSIFSHIVDRFAAKAEGTCSKLIAQISEGNAQTAKDKAQITNKERIEKTKEPIAEIQELVTENKEHIAENIEEIKDNHEHAARKKKQSTENTGDAAEKKHKKKQ